MGHLVVRLFLCKMHMGTEPAKTASTLKRFVGSPISRVDS